MLKKNVVISIFLLITVLLNAQQVALTESAAQIGADFFWDPFLQSGLLSLNGRQLQFKAGEPLVLLNNRKLDIVDAPRVVNGTVFVSQTFDAYARNYLLTIPIESYYRIGAILIDPGHGGKDSGAVATHTVNGKKIQLREKDVVLQVSLDLYEQLKKAYPDKKILLTRKDDTFLSLEERVEMANMLPLAEHEAILYISVHANSVFNKKATGYEVWYLSPGYRRTVVDVSHADKEILPILNSMLEEEFTTESILIAKYLLDGIAAQVGSLSPSRGIKEEEWFVVRNANMPSVLAEIGFISSPVEAALLADPAYLHKIATGMYNGMTSFITVFERSKGFTATQ